MDNEDFSTTTVVLNKSNSDGFLEYPFDLVQIVKILDNDSD